jgi:CoA:oxalate CoA-transferase
VTRLCRRAAGDARFATSAAHCENEARLKRPVEAVTPGETVAYRVAWPEAAGVPTGRVEDMGEVQRDPQLRARHMVQTVTPDGGRKAILGWLMRG